VRADQPLGLLLLFLAAILGGGLNGLAGGGSFVVFPALIFTAVPPVNANATSTVALWPASLTAANAYRKELAQDHDLRLLLVVSVLGGLGGALLLLHSSQSFFRHFVPFLMLGATALFALGPRISKARAEHAAPRGLVALLQAPISIYGGYFGGGMGIMMLALYSSIGASDYHFANARKNLLATVTNGIAVLTFIVAGAVVWLPAVIMLFGSALGGGLSVVIARRIDQRVVRPVVVLIGLVMSIYLLITAGF